MRGEYQDWIAAGLLKRGKSKGGLAEALGIHQSQITRLLAGKRQLKAEEIPVVSAYLEEPAPGQTLPPAKRVNRTDQVSEQSSTKDLVLASDLVGQRDLPVYGSVEAGAGCVVVSNEPVDSVRRPAPLENVKDGYGVIVRGESMSPLIRPGDIVLVHPHLPPRIQDCCVFRHERDGEFVATIKEYCGQNATTWKVKRYQPKEEIFTLKKKDFPECHVVVGKYNRR